MKIICKYNLIPIFDFICFPYKFNKKQYLDTLHKQKKIIMHRRMHNSDFDIFLRSVHLSPKLQIPKIHKNIQKSSVICTTRVEC